MTWKNHSRQNNPIVFGIPEHEGFDYEDCKQIVTEFLQFAGVDKEISSAERCHSTPTQKVVGAVKPRMIHTAFKSFMYKEKVCKGCLFIYIKLTNFKKKNQIKSVHGLAGN